MNKHNKNNCPFCNSDYTKYLKQKDRYWCFNCNKYFHNEWLTAQDIRKLENIKNADVSLYNIRKSVSIPAMIFCPHCKSNHIQFSTVKMKYWCYDCNMYL